MALSLINEFSAVGLDFDGTMAIGNLHTPARLMACDQLAVELGVPRLATIDPRVHAEAHEHGATSEAINAWALAEEGIISDPTDIKHPLVQAVATRKKLIHGQLVAEGQHEVPGSTRFVKIASVEKPGRLGIVTTASMVEVGPHLLRHRLNKYIPRQRIVASEDLIDPLNTKPHPEAYSIFLGRLSVTTPSDALAVEDTPGGIESARAAGLTVAAIASSHSFDLLTGLKGNQKPDVVVEDYDELGSILGISK